MAEMIKAPFDKSQCNSLNQYQKSGVMHEFTCEDGHRLVAWAGGWLCGERSCKNTQDWAWDWMADFSWRSLDHRVRGVHGVWM